jgi:hypothetical protein
MSVAGGEPDIELAATASGRDLRFRTQPHVALHADEIVATRAGLPWPVRAGVIYRRFAASTRLASRLRASGAIGDSNQADEPPCRGAADAP